MPQSHLHNDGRVAPRSASADQWAGGIGASRLSVDTRVTGAVRVASSSHDPLGDASDPPSGGFVVSLALATITTVSVKHPTDQAFDPAEKQAFRGVERLASRSARITCVLVGTQLILAVDASIVTIVAPAIQRGLNLSAAGLQWTINSYSLGLGGLLLLGGRAADIYGPKKTFVAGTLGFAAASAAAGVAGSVAVLVAARAAQGASAAAIVPSALGLLMANLPAGPARTRAIAVNGSMIAVGFIVGAVVGGLVTPSLGWRAIFWLNVPVCSIVAIVGWLGTQGSPQMPREPLDVGGSIMLAVGLAALGFAIAALGQPDPLVPISGVVFAGCATAALVRIEAHTASPIIPVGAIRQPAVVGSAVAAAGTSCAAGATLISVALYLQNGLLWSPLRAATFFLIPGLGAVAAGPIGGGWISRGGERTPMLVGLGLCAVGAAVLGALPWPEQAAATAAAALSCSGYVLTVGAATGAVTASVAPGYRATAAALVMTAIEFGSALGVAGALLLAPALATRHCAQLTAGVAHCASLVMLRRALFAAATTAAVTAAVCWRVHAGNHVGAGRTVR
jgi:MFS family permease